MRSESHSEPGGPPGSHLTLAPSTGVTSLCSLTCKLGFPPPVPDAWVGSAVTDPVWWPGPLRGPCPQVPTSFSIKEKERRYSRRQEL